MNGYQSSAKPFSERELDLQRVSDFHAVLLGMAAHDFAIFSAGERRR